MSERDNFGRFRHIDKNKFTQGPFDYVLEHTLNSGGEMSNFLNSILNISNFPPLKIILLKNNDEWVWSPNAPSHPSILIEFLPAMTLQDQLNHSFADIISPIDSTHTATISLMAVNLSEFKKLKTIIETNIHISNQLSWDISIIDLGVSYVGSIDKFIEPK